MTYKIQVGFTGVPVANIKKFKYVTVTDDGRIQVRIRCEKFAGEDGAIWHYNANQIIAGGECERWIEYFSTGQRIPEKAFMGIEREEGNG